MADRQAAELFASIFKKLASDPTPQHVRWAAEFWTKSTEYDFSPYQMYCDKALVSLCLARKGVNPKYPEDGETMLYGPEDE